AAQRSKLTYPLNKTPAELYHYFVDAVHMSTTSPRRVLYWSERFWPAIGGVGISASKLLPALRARGYEFVVVTSKDYSDLPEEDHFKGISLYRFPFWSCL